MKIFFQKTLVIAWLAVSACFMFAPLLPSTVFAQNKAPDQTDEQRCAEFKKQFNVGGINIADNQPFFCSASDVILVAIRYLTVISGVVTVLFLIVGGFWYLTSAGNEEQTEKGKKTIVNSIIGLIVITLAYTIVRIIASTLHSTN